MYKTILVDNPAANYFVITLNRPDKHNAINAAMLLELQQVLLELKSQPCRLLTITGSGKHFCAGADLNWMKAQKEMDHHANLDDVNLLSDLLHLLDTFPCPVLAIINGACLGGALGLVACADISIASDSAIFCLSEVKLGLIPATISQYLQRNIGTSAMRRYALTAEQMNAAQALQLGLIQQVEAAEHLNRIEHHIYRQVMHNSPDAVSQCKALLNQQDGLAITEQTRRYAAQQLAQIRQSPPAQQGISAFLSKTTMPWQIDCEWHQSTESTPAKSESGS